MYLVPVVTCAILFLITWKAATSLANTERDREAEIERVYQRIDNDVRDLHKRIDDVTTQMETVQRELIRENAAIIKSLKKS